jgi:RNA polymerase sigma-70 factor (ECF subfamily)
LTPEKIYERRWALTLLEQAMNRLRDECVTSGKSALFDQVKSVLAGERPDFAYAEVSARLGMSEGALTVAAHRLRQRYGQLLRDVVAQTVSNPVEMEEEIRHLFTVLGG